MQRRNNKDWLRANFHNLTRNLQSTEFLQKLFAISVISDEVYMDIVHTNFPLEKNIKLISNLLHKSEEKIEEFAKVLKEFHHANLVEDFPFTDNLLIQPTLRDKNLQAAEKMIEKALELIESAKSISASNDEAIEDCIETIGNKFDSLLATIRKMKKSVIKNAKAALNNSYEVLTTDHVLSSAQSISNKAKTFVKSNGRSEFNIHKENQKLKSLKLPYSLDSSSFSFMFDHAQFEKKLSELDSYFPTTNAKILSNSLNLTTQNMKVAFMNPETVFSLESDARNNSRHIRKLKKDNNSLKPFRKMFTILDPKEEGKSICCFGNKVVVGSNKALYSCQEHDFPKLNSIIQFKDWHISALSSNNQFLVIARKDDNSITITKYNLIPKKKIPLCNEILSNFMKITCLNYIWLKEIDTPALRMFKVDVVNNDISELKVTNVIEASDDSLFCTKNNVISILEKDKVIFYDGSNGRLIKSCKIALHSASDFLNFEANAIHLQINKMIKFISCYSNAAIIESLRPEM